jgi:hypothetical protein
MGYKTHNGKVKSHTGVTNNDETDTRARNIVVEGHKTPDILFTDSDPPVGGLRTWPQIRKASKDSPHIITKLADLDSSFRKIIRAHTSNPTHDKQAIYGTIYSQILHKARTSGLDHTIHVDSTSPFRARRDSLEVTWGVHIHRCKRKHNPSLICTKCQSPLTNTHILGSCQYIAKLKTKRHNSTFQLLLQLLQNRMEDVGPSCVRILAINRSLTLIT